MVSPDFTKELMLSKKPNIPRILPMLAHVRELYHYRDLLWVWTLRDIKVRYKQSFLGSAWAILQPLSMALIFTAVFSFLMRLPTDDIPYPLFAYVALLPWTLFTTSVSFAIPSLVNNMNLLTKIYFPREVLPISAVGASLVDFLIASVAFVGMLIFYRWPIYPTVVFVPFILFIQLLFTVGIVLFASAVNVFYRDIRFIVPLGIQLWLYATPVIYPVTLIPEHLRPYYMLNPMASIIDSYRRVMLKGDIPDLGYLAIGAGFAAIVFIIGYSYFKRAEKVFADFV
jgi:lipopolysaccharide transport system permease protein